ncbi:MAG: DsrE/DsrF/DrsH-like family protein [Acidimicrobiia bacterium]|nr:DsrE/DsrF/DrsH-like family protein [Acidimicrobiia bacterium]
MTAQPVETIEPIAEAPPRRKRLALVASKGTLDQAYPPLILATTAASLGWEVGIYFTFYGLDILHRDRLEKLKVASLANPSGPIQIPNLLGALPGATAAATKVMKKWMRDSKMPDVPEFIEMAQGLDVTFFACATTMGVMGVEEGDLIKGCEIAGAAAFLDYAAAADVQLFV